MEVRISVHRNLFLFLLSLLSVHVTRTVAMLRAMQNTLAIVAGNISDKILLSLLSRLNMPI